MSCAPFNIPTIFFNFFEACKELGAMLNITSSPSIDVLYRSVAACLEIHKQQIYVVLSPISNQLPHLDVKAYATYQKRALSLELSSCETQSIEIRPGSEEYVD